MARSSATGAAVERATSPTDSLIFAMSPVTASPLAFSHTTNSFASTSNPNSNSKHASTSTFASSNTRTRSSSNEDSVKGAAGATRPRGPGRGRSQEEFMYSMPRFTPHPLLRSTLRSRVNLPTEPSTHTKEGNSKSSASSSSSSRSSSKSHVGSRMTSSISGSDGDSTFASTSASQQASSSSSLHPYPSPPCSYNSSPIPDSGMDYLQHKSSSSSLVHYSPSPSASRALRTFSRPISLSPLPKSLPVSELSFPPQSALPKDSPSTSFFSGTMPSGLGSGSGSESSTPSAPIPIPRMNRRIVSDSYLYTTGTAAAGTSVAREAMKKRLNSGVVPSGYWYSDEEEEEEDQDEEEEDGYYGEEVDGNACREYAAEEDGSVSRSVERGEVQEVEAVNASRTGAEQGRGAFDLEVEELDVEPQAQPHIFHRFEYEYDGYRTVPPSPSLSPSHSASVSRSPSPAPNARSSDRRSRSGSTSLAEFSMLHSVPRTAYTCASAITPFEACYELEEDGEGVDVDVNVEDIDEGEFSGGRGRSFHRRTRGMSVTMGMSVSKGVTMDEVSTRKSEWFDDEEDGDGEDCYSEEYGRERVPAFFARGRAMEYGAGIEPKEQEESVSTSPASSFLELSFRRGGRGRGRQMQRC